MFYLKNLVFDSYHLDSGDYWVMQAWVVILGLGRVKGLVLFI